MYAQIWFSLYKTSAGSFAANPTAGVENQRSQDVHNRLEENKAENSHLKLLQQSGLGVGWK